MPACSTTVSTDDSIKISPTSTREARCRDSEVPGGCSPLRYTTRRTPASLAAAATFCAERLSSATKSRDVPIEWTK